MRLSVNVKMTRNATLRSKRPKLEQEDLDVDKVDHLEHGKARTASSSRSSMRTRTSTTAAKSAGENEASILSDRSVSPLSETAKKSKPRPADLGRKDLDPSLELQEEEKEKAQNVKQERDNEVSKRKRKAKAASSASEELTELEELENGLLDNSKKKKKQKKKLVQEQDKGRQKKYKGPALQPFDYPKRHLQSK